MAWLFGPRLVRQQQQQQQPRGNFSPTLPGRFVDQPPVAWLAYPEGTLFGPVRNSDRLKPSPGRHRDRRAAGDRAVAGEPLEDGGPPAADRAAGSGPCLAKDKSPKNRPAKAGKSRQRSLEEEQQQPPQG